MSAPRYATLTDLRDYLSSSSSLGTAQDGLLTDCLLRAEGGINDYTRRDFAGTAGTVYYSRWTGEIRSNALYLDRDLHTLTGLVNGDGASIAIGSVWVEPRNDGPPYRILRLKSSYVYTFNTDSEITVSGTFGFSTVAPDAIRQSTVRWAAHLFRQKDVGPTDMAGFPEGGQVSLPKGMPDDVRWLLSPYRSRSGGVL